MANKKSINIVPPVRREVTPAERMSAVSAQTSMKQERGSKTSQKTKVQFFHNSREPRASIRFLRKSNVIIVTLTGKESDDERIAIVRDVVAFTEKEGLTL